MSTSNCINGGGALWICLDWLSQQQPGRSICIFCFGHGQVMFITKVDITERIASPMWSEVDGHWSNKELAPVRSCRVLVFFQNRMPLPLRPKRESEFIDSGLSPHHLTVSDPVVPVQIFISVNLLKMGVMRAALRTHIDLIRMPCAFAAAVFRNSRLTVPL